MWKRKQQIRDDQECQNWRKVQVAQSCLTLCDPMDYTVRGILQARILEWVAFPFSRGSSLPRDRTQVSHIAGGFLTVWATRETQQNCEVTNGVEGFRFFVCLFLYFHMKSSLGLSQESFSHQRFSGKKQESLSNAFWPPPFKSCPYHWKFYRGKEGEREKRKHKQIEEEREIFYEKLT